MQRATSQEGRASWEERQEKRGEPTPDRSSRSEREIAMGPLGWGQGSESLVGPCSKTFPVRPRGYPFRASWRVPLIARRPISPFSRGKRGGRRRPPLVRGVVPAACAKWDSQGRPGTARDGQEQSGQSQGMLGAVPIAGARSAQRPRPASDGVLLELSSSALPTAMRCYLLFESINNQNNR